MPVDVHAGAPTTSPSPPRRQRLRLVAGGVDDDQPELADGAFAMKGIWVDDLRPHSRVRRVQP